MERIKLLVADDSEIARTGYTIMLSKNNLIEICGFASQARQVISMKETLRPDVILLDIVMPETDGLTLCRDLILKDEHAKVILNTAHVKDDVISRMLTCGAKGCLHKDANSEEIERAIITVYKGGEYFNRQVCNMLIQKLLQTNSDSHKDFWKGQFTEREIEIIKLTSQELSAVEIGKKLFLSKRTVEVSRSAILKKMNVTSTLEMIVHAYKTGLLSPRPTVSAN